MHISTLKTLLSEIERLHALSMDETLSEDETDVFYAEFWNRAMETAALVTNFAQIEADTAKKMVIHHRADLLTLLARAV